MMFNDMYAGFFDLGALVRFDICTKSESLLKLVILQVIRSSRELFLSFPFFIFFIENYATKPESK